MAVLAVGVLVFAGGVPDNQRTDEVRLQEVAVRLKCLQCAGESVAASQAPLAEQFRTEIAEQIDRGVSDDEIVDYFVERYGEEVLLEPSTSGVSLLIWVLPAAVVVGAVGALVFAFRRWNGAGEHEEPEAAGESAGAEVAASGSSPVERPEPDGTAKPEGEPAAAGGKWRPVLIGLGVVAFVGLAAWLVSWGSSDRGGGEATGGTGTVSGELARCQPLAIEDPQAAIECYDGVLELDSDNAQALTYRGWANLRAGDREAGLEDLEAAVASDGSLADPHVFLAIDARDTGDYSGAAAQMELFWSKGPSEVAVSVVSSEGLEREIFFGLMDAPTRACWQQAAQSGEDRGLDQQFLDDLGLCLDVVLAADPDDPDAMLSRALAHIGPESADPEPARELLDRLLEADPENSDALALRMSIDLLEGDLEAAEARLVLLEELPRGPAAFLIGDAATLATVLESASTEAPDGSTSGSSGSGEGG